MKRIPQPKEVIMNRVKTLLTAGFALAIALTLSCSGGDDGGGDPGSSSGSTNGGGGGCPNAVVGNGILTCGGQTYKTVQIGDQIWMAENLNYNASGSKCYNNNSTNCNIYGRLYNWTQATSACPSGWHLPSDDEWTMLTDYVGSSTAGTKLKATNGWNSNGNGTDDYGFSALPGGSGDSYYFYEVGDYGSWWSSTENTASRAWYRDLGYGVGRYSNDKSHLYSVRCVKDDWSGNSSSSSNSSSGSSSSSNGDVLGACNLSVYGHGVACVHGFVPSLCNESGFPGAMGVYNYEWVSQCPPSPDMECLKDNYKVSWYFGNNSSFTCQSVGMTEDNGSGGGSGSCPAAVETVYDQCMASSGANGNESNPAFIQCMLTNPICTGYTTVAACGAHYGCY
jgi:uncharacterized protein (TIGR02145 family)